MSKTLAVITTLDAGLPDNSLPGDQPGIDNSLPGWERPIDPGFGIPLPPVIDNKPPVGPPGHPGTGPVRPTYPVDPDYDFPVRPGLWPHPPIHRPDNSLPIQPVRPELPIYYPPGGEVTPPINLPPGSVWPPLPPSAKGKFIALCWIIGVGYRWVVIDTSLKPDIGLPVGPPDSIDNTLPPHAQPKK